MTDFTYTEDAEDYKEDDLEEMPITVVGDLKQYQFPRSEGVHCLEVHNKSDSNVVRRRQRTHRKRYRSHEGAEETPPERLDVKVVTHFLCASHEIEI